MEPGKWLARPLFTANEEVTIVSSLGDRGFLVTKHGSLGVHHVPLKSIKILSVTQ